MSGGWIGLLNKIRRRMESRDQVMALCGSSLHSNHSKLSDITAGKLSVKSQFITHNFNKAMASEWHQSSTHGFHRVRKSCNKKQTFHPPRKYSVQNESVLDEQSISVKIVSLILCVGYVKSGHIYSSYCQLQRVSTWQPACVLNIQNKLVLLILVYSQDNVQCSIQIL